jgi:CheY-specific phosphatase CheX
MSDFTDQRTQLRPVPTGDVAKIAQLVHGRQTASLEEIAKIIKSDASVTGRLMARAYPRAPARETATIQQATSRVGLNYVVVLFIADLLTKCVLETFESILSLSLKKDDPAAMLIEDSGCLIASVPFTGKATGKVSLAFSNDLSLLVAVRLFAGQPDVKYNLETMGAAVAEVVTLITSSLHTGLNNADLPSEVGQPEVILEQTFPRDDIPGATTEQFYFRQGTHGLRVNLCINPFAAD